MRRLVISAPVALTLLLFGAGCRPQAAAPMTDLSTIPPAEVSVANGSAPEPVDVATTQPEPQPFYVAYTAEEYARAQAVRRPVLLYFWAAWCPICLAEEPKLRAVVESSELPIAGFRVNFDTEDALKKEFRIPYQHTTVILDANGQESARFTGPIAEADLLAALAAASQ